MFTSAPGTAESMPGSVVCTACLLLWVCLRILAQISLRGAPELVFPCQEHLLCCPAVGGKGSRGTLPTLGWARLLSREQRDHLRVMTEHAWLRAVVIPETASVLLGPIRRKEATPLQLGVCDWPIPASREPGRLAPLHAYSLGGI